MTMPNNATAAPAGPSGTPAGDDARPGGARAQIREVKDQVVDQAKSSFRQARDSATSSLSDSRNQAADRIGGIGNAFRRASEHLRIEQHDGVANLADSLAGQVDRIASYMREGDLRGLRNDLENLARRQPAVAIGAAVALGMLAARFIKSSQRSGDGAGYDMGSSQTGGGYGGT